MSGTVLSRTDRHTQHSSGAARSATALRRTATAPPASVAPAVAPAAGTPPADADASDAEPASAPPIDAAPLHAGPVHAGPVHAGPVHADAPTIPDAAGSGAPDSPTAAAVTVTLAIPLTGEALTPQAYRLLDALRELVELGQGTVTTTAVPGARAGAHDTLPGIDDGAAPYRPGAGPPDDDGHRGEPRNGAERPARAASPAARHPESGDRPVDPAEVRLLTASRQVMLGGEPLPMTRLEFDLLLFLAGNPRRVFTRAQLLGAVWGYEHTGERTVDVHVRRLRVKMGVQVPLITTVYGVGYRLDDDARIVVVSHA